MLRKASNVYSVLLSDASKLTATAGVLPAAGATVTDANLAAGAVVVCDMGMRRLQSGTGTNGFGALSNTDKFFIVQGRGAGIPLMKSPAITKGNITVTGAKFKAAVQQVTYVGYGTTTTNSLGDATTGLVAINSKYWIKVRKRDNDAANRSQPMSLFAGPVKTADTTQVGLARQLVKNGYKNFIQEPANGYLKMEMVCSNAGSVTTATTGTLTPSYNSKIVAASGTNPVTEFPVGSGVRFGTALTDPIYYVTASNATSITLDTPYLGTSGATFAAGAANYITPANMILAATKFGIKITGVVAPFNVNSFRDYYANRFTVTYSDSTVGVTSVGANDGNGVWQKVAMDEYMNYGFEGQNNQLAVPSIARDQVVKIPGVNSNTDQSSRYSAFMVNWTESMLGITSTDNGEGSVLVYCNLTDVSTGVVTLTTAEEMVNTILTSASAAATAMLTTLNM